MRNDHEKIAKLFEEINSNNKTIKELKDERDEKLKEKLSLRQAQLMMDLEEINSNYKRRIKLFNHLCIEYRYADLRESREILKRIRNLFQ